MHTQYGASPLQLIMLRIEDKLDCPSRIIGCWVVCVIWVRMSLYPCAFRTILRSQRQTVAISFEVAYLATGIITSAARRDCDYVGSRIWQVIPSQQRFICICFATASMIFHMDDAVFTTIYFSVQRACHSYSIQSDPGDRSRKVENSVCRALHYYIAGTVSHSLFSLMICHKTVR